MTQADTKAYDSRRTSFEKLSAARALANDMIRVGASEPNDVAMKKLVIFGERLHRILDGDFDTGGGTNDVRATSDEIG